MTWVREHTPAASTFAVVSDDSWPVDRTSEWFPVLSGRTSVATVQGQEWIDGGAFQSRIADYDALQECARRNAACLDAWSADTGEPIDYVYIPKIAPRFDPLSETKCCIGLQLALAGDPAFRQVYDGPGALIFERR
jgi:hypothetical protein